MISVLKFKQLKLRRIKLRRNLETLKRLKILKRLESLSDSSLIFLVCYYNSYLFPSSSKIKLIKVSVNLMTMFLIVYVTKKKKLRVQIVQGSKKALAMAMLAAQIKLSINSKPNLPFESNLTVLVQSRIPSSSCSNHPAMIDNTRIVQEVKQLLKTQKKLVTETIPICGVGSFFIGRGINRMRACKELTSYEMIVGGIETSWGTYLVNRFWLKTEYQMDTTKVWTNSVALLFVGNATNFYTHQHKSLSDSLQECLTRESELQTQGTLAIQMVKDTLAQKGRSDALRFEVNDRQQECLHALNNCEASLKSSQTDLKVKNSSLQACEVNLDKSKDSLKIYQKELLQTQGALGACLASSQSQQGQSQKE